MNYYVIILIYQCILDVNGARELFSSKQLNFNRPGFRNMVKRWGYYRPSDNRIKTESAPNEYVSIQCILLISVHELFIIDQKLIKYLWNQNRLKVYTTYYSPICLLSKIVHPYDLNIILIMMLYYYDLDLKIEVLYYEYNVIISIYLLRNYFV